MKKQPESQKESGDSSGECWLSGWNKSIPDLFSIAFSDHVMSQGTLLDPYLLFEKEVEAVARSAFLFTSCSNALQHDFSSLESFLKFLSFISH